MKQNYPNLTLFVFSNDLNWVKNNFKFNVPVEFVESCEEDYEELFLMSYCNHNIVANSTFSWWGAWLNNNPNKKIFTPFPWHRDGWGGDTIVPKNWYKVPIDFDENPPFAPMLSIVFFVENDSATINTSLRNICGQLFKDYELIIVSASTDGSDRTCRKFINNRNVTFVKVDYSTKKYAAWNKGINCSRGDYILLLSGSDAIVVNATQTMAAILHRLYQAYNTQNIEMANSDASTSYEDYILKIAPNIFCSTKYFVTSKSQNNTLSVREDVQFSQFKSIANLKIADRNKINFIVTEKINNFFGTKFFKRSFLNSHNIRFDENLTGTNAEMKFLIDTFLYIEDIIFLPTPLYVHLEDYQK